MKLKKIPTTALVIFFCSMLGWTAQAADLSGTLKKIKNDKVIVLGYRESSVPWSYIDSSTNKVVGYSHETALLIVDAIKQELGLPDLQVREIPITAQNRISLIQNGSIDLECNGTTNTAERRRQVALSDTFAITQTQLLTKKSSGVHDMSDLAGKTVVVTAGSTSERYMRTYVQQKHMDTNIVSAKDHSQAFLMLQSDRAAAFFMDRDVLSALLLKARDAADYVVTGRPQTKEALACMLRKDDPQFKALVDKTIAAMQTSGKAEKMYNRWFMSPIPPKGDVLNAPLSDAMRELYAHPNDRSFDE
ncbi:transporter substrate-binding domain-containing protein [Glaciimonas soli]|uniref:Transporter substrate-binding domain-containing protein n=1 Tax=Glaciimonas soli TaxID=2590999 RepID=A0A843YRA7_9BURK|nr:transporter substrate-binding domain-containing protein [Glaciimonas soli]MQR02075.1 transporter substrate-binding domain-containing protein [Glaciimonas soli]